MLLIDGSPGSTISLFLDQLQHDSIDCSIQPYDQWIHDHELCTDKHAHHEHPKGIVFIRVSPEIAYSRMRLMESSSKTSSLLLKEIQELYSKKEESLIEKVQNVHNALYNLPILVLDGNIDFRKDFSHYYNHVFYIKKFIKELQEKEAMIAGTYTKKNHRHCC